MKLGTSQRGTLVPALVALTVLAATAALASRAEPPATPEPGPPVQTGRSGHRDGGPEAGDTPEPVCTDALEAGGSALEHARGLDRAIEAILDRCERTPGALGLLNALARLQENRERHAANEHPPDHAGGGPTQTPHGRGADHREGPPKGVPPNGSATAANTERSAQGHAVGR